MILQRIANGFKNQDWFVVVLEIFVVVIGIYIGLQVDDWQKERENRAMEQEYLERLYEDIQGSIDDQLENDPWDERRISSQEVVLTALKRGELLEAEEEEFTWGLTAFGIMNPVRLRWATVEELKSTGNLSIIRDLELRQMIGLFEGEFARRQDLMDKSNEYILVSRMYFQGRYAIEKGPLNQATAVFDFEALAGDKELYNRLTQAQDNSNFIRGAQAQHLEDLEELKTRIAEALGVGEAE